MSSFALRELAERVGGRVVGDPERRVTGIRSLEEAEEPHLSFYHNRRYLEAARASRAGALLVGDEGSFAGRCLIVCHEPYAAFAELLGLFQPPRRPLPGVHPSAVVSPSARLGESVSVGPHTVLGEGAVLGEGVTVEAGCVVGDGAAIGADSWLHPHVVIEPGCRIGERCILHAGVVIGSDGFGFALVAGEHRKVPQVGIVVIEDDVELGANVCVDRATLGETRICRGTKVDNLVQIAHNVQVGEHSLLVALVGIAGSTRLGHHVVMAGQSGAVGHVSIGDRVKVSAQAGVTEDAPAGSWVTGFPARPHREWLRAMANLFQLEELRRRLKSLERAVLGGGGGA